MVDDWMCLEASKDCDMKKKLLVLLFSLASLALVSCGGGNDVASTGATAVSAAAPVTTTASAPSTPTTEPKVNGQIDEQTGVAPVAAQMTVWTVYSNGGCGNSSSFGGRGPALNRNQHNACVTAIMNSPNPEDCINLGGGLYRGPDYSYFVGGCVFLFICPNCP